MDSSEVIAGRFELLGVLGRGAMGEVRKARDLETGDTVAVKRLLRRRDGTPVSLTEADANAARFMREVRIMARLSSPNLPQTVTGGLDGDQPYLAMEYIDGVPLSSLLAEADAGRLASGLGCRDRRPDRHRARRGAPGRRGSPGPEAVQPHARQERAGEGPRLRRGTHPRRR